MLQVSKDGRYVSRPESVFVYPLWNCEKIRQVFALSSRNNCLFLTVTEKLRLILIVLILHLHLKGVCPSVRPSIRSFVLVQVSGSSAVSSEDIRQSAYASYEILLLFAIRCSIAFHHSMNTNYTFCFQ